MKKTLLAAIVILVAALIFAPFLNGLALEKIVTRGRDNLNALYEQQGSDVRIGILDYDRGFASSTIKWRIDLGSLAAVYGVKEIILVDRAKHGLAGIETSTSLEDNPWFIDLVDNRLKGENPLSIKTVYSLTGRITSTIDLKAFVLAMDGKTIEFRPGRIVTAVDSDLNHFVSTLNWNGLSLPEKAEVDAVAIHYDLHKISTYIWEGQADYRIGALQVRDPEKHLEFQGFSGDYNLDFDNADKLFSVKGSMGIARLQAEDEVISDVVLQMEINNIDSRGYDNFMGIYTGSVYAFLQAMTAAGNDPEKLKALTRQQLTLTGLQLIAASEQLLKKGLEIKITDLEARLPRGEVTGNLAVGLNKDLTFAELSPILMQPRLALDIFSVQSNLRVPAELAGENSSLRIPLSPGMQTGFFVRQGANLVHNAQTRDNKLFLNDSEVIFN